jgi:hypothetical protein
LEAREIKVEVKFTDGWEDRVAKAAYSLYLRIEKGGGKDELAVA